MGHLERTDVQTWIDGYTDAWRSPGTSRLDRLFTSDIRYSVSPWKQPIAGLQELKVFWEQKRTGYDEVFELRSEIVAVEGRVAVARIGVTYEKDNPSQWRDLWILHFDEQGLCRLFEEWPFSPEQSDGQDL